MFSGKKNLARADNNNNNKNNGSQIFEREAQSFEKFVTCSNMVRF
jgi:hypothetical protein